jgi:cytochrome c5
MSQTEKEAAKAAAKAQAAAEKEAAKAAANTSQDEALQAAAEAAAQAAYEAVLAGHAVTVAAKAAQPEPTKISKAEWERRTKLSTDNVEFINKSLGHYEVE